MSGIQAKDENSTNMHRELTYLKEQESQRKEQQLPTKHNRPWDTASSSSVSKSILQTQRGTAALTFQLAFLSLLLIITVIMLLLHKNFNVTNIVFDWIKFLLNV